MQDGIFVGMEEDQNVTNQVTTTEDIVPKYKYELLTQIQQAYIDWKAVSGLITDDDGIRKVTVDQLAAQYGIARKTFYEQTSHIPNLQELINQRRLEIAPRSRIAKVHETWYLKAVKGDWQHMNSWLYNFDPDYKVPTQKHEVQHELGNTWTALAQAKIKQEPIEGEVVDVTTGNDNDGAVQSAPRVLPQAS